MKNHKLNCILLVDDDAICNFINRKVLSHLQIAREIKTSANGKEALDMVNEYLRYHGRFPDLIFVDLKMPVMDGFDFIENFKILSACTGISTNLVILSTSGHMKDRERIRLVSELPFIIKPLSPQKTMEICHNLFDYHTNPLGNP